MSDVTRLASGRLARLTGNRRTAGRWSKAGQYMARPLVEVRLLDEERGPTRIFWVGQAEADRGRQPDGAA